MMNVIAIGKITIPPHMYESTPNEGKLDKQMADFLAGECTKPVVLNRAYMLVDGYIRYLVYQHFNQSYIPFVFQDEKNDELKASVVKFAGMVCTTEENDAEIRKLFINTGKYFLLIDPDDKHKYDILEIV